MKKLIVLPLLILTLVIAACSSPTPEQPQPTPTEVPATEEPMAQDIVDTAVADGRFSTLVAAVQAAGLVDTLKGDGPFTVFAPTDEAFAKLPADTLESLLADPEALSKILLYHVVAGKVMASDVVNLTSADTAAGIAVPIKVENGEVMVGDAKVIVTDVPASNGVIHAIDTVLLPPSDDAMSMDIVDTAIADGRFTTLVAALQDTGLVDTLKGDGPFTVFAPTDEAFARAGSLDTFLADPEALSKILLYHVVAGKVMASDVVNLTSADTAAGIAVPIKVENGEVMVGDAKVILTDIPASNGVIHVIDNVLLPPSDDAMSMDIVDTAVADGRFSTLVAAVQAAGLVDTLKGDGPFTVFAPTDEAFAKLPTDTLDALLADPEALSKILLYHVVPGKVMAADVVNLTSADTAAGIAVPIKVENGEVMVGDAKVILTDVPASNGVIHAIDTVILPPES